MMNEIRQAIYLPRQDRLVPIAAIEDLIECF